MSEYIVEFPSPLSEREQKMVYGFKGELVRCKDCKWWGESLTEEERNRCDVWVDLVCSYWASDGLTGDDFCSYGERREDE